MITNHVVSIRLVTREKTPIRRWVPTFPPQLKALKTVKIESFVHVNLSKRKNRLLSTKTKARSEGSSSVVVTREVSNGRSNLQGKSKLTRSLLTLETKFEWFKLLRVVYAISHSALNLSKCAFYFERFMRTKRRAVCSTCVFLYLRYSGCSGYSRGDREVVFFLNSLDRKI